MPVRIRLAYHPLAKKKQPLYHIVAANAKTGRQRKPLEVLGVYDPIPRYPTLSTGEVLEDQNKIKQISMNIDRVKHWLSVGAQPSDHCARLLEKAGLMPEKPQRQKSENRIYKSAKEVPEVLQGWGQPDQGISSALPRTKRFHGKEVLTATIANKGEHIQKEIRDKANELVHSVLNESRPNKTSIHIGRPNLHAPYVKASRKQLIAYVRTWLESIPVAPGRRKKVKDTVELQGRNFVLRIFMAYTKPACVDDARYNLARFLLLEEWINIKFKTIARNKFRDKLPKLFKMWEQVIIKLEEDGRWGEAERELRDDIFQRSRLLSDQTNKEWRRKEWDAWKVLLTSDK